jgi:hypothetical protein
MSLVGPIELLLLNLEEDISPEYVFLHVDKEIARRRLNEISGQDFGFDVIKWRDWLKANGFLSANQSE